MGLPLSNCETSPNLHRLHMLPNPELINKREVLSCLWHHFYSLSTIFFSESFVHILNIPATSKECSYSATKQGNLQNLNKNVLLFLCFCRSDKAKHCCSWRTGLCCAHFKCLLLLRLLQGHKLFSKHKTSKTMIQGFQKEWKTHKELITEFSVF